tara:strand:+ start:2232 stop:2813 length:582 start_codon:yes stop_codon:yes gene_type:complete
MTTTRPTIDRSLIDKIAAIKPKYITTNGFINMLLEEAYNAKLQKEEDLTDNVTYIYKDNKDLEEQEQDKEELETKEQKEKINKKEKQEKIIPEDLIHLEELILDFWKVKKGSKSIQAWKLQITEYRKFIDKYGEQTLKDQLDAGVLAGTWKGLKLSNYEEQQKRINRFNKEPEQTSTHPNQKVVQFDDMGNII